MFKVDFAAVHGAALAVVDAAEGRLPLNVVVDEVEKRGVSLGEDGEVILRAICAASTVMDLRAGRAGGVGRREWFKGGRSTVEPTGAATPFESLGQGPAKLAHPERWPYTETGAS